MYTGNKKSGRQEVRPMSNEILDIAARMKELREICEYTQEEMAQALGVEGS